MSTARALLLDQLHLFITCSLIFFCVHDVLIIINKQLSKIYFICVSSPNDAIYYCRELLCHSLDGLRVDLITVSDHNGIEDREEPRFDSRLFPDHSASRCRNFVGKTVNNLNVFDV